MSLGLAANGTLVSRTSVYRLRVRTDSADEHGFLLLADEQLVAVLIELADEGHGNLRGKWIIETMFGLGQARVPDSFRCAADAAAWVSEHISTQLFQFGEQVVEIR